METDNKIRLEKARMHGLVYRLRKKGVRINSKQKTIFLDDYSDIEEKPKRNKRTENQIRRLIEEFKFEVQSEIPKEEPKIYIDWSAIK